MITKKCYLKYKARIIVYKFEHNKKCELSIVYEAFVFFFTASLFISFTHVAQVPPNTPAPEFTWETSSHEFGDIHQGEKVEHTFKFTNTGKAPLIITNVQVTCGCTTPKGWLRDPIAVGEKSEITVSFNSSGKIGKQNKVVTIVSNATGNNVLTFSANVLDKKLNQ